MERVVEVKFREELRDGEFKEEEPENLRYCDDGCCAHKNESNGRPNISYLHVLLIREILNILLQYLDPQNAVEFLSIHPLATFDMTGWIIMRRALGMTNELMASKLIGGDCLTDAAAVTAEGIKISSSSVEEEKPVLYKDERDFMLHIIRKYGFCCTDCFTLLDGPKGFFCCTSLCKACSEAKFRGAEFVDSVVRFYLCGDENITVRGRAFLVHPFWYSLHDESTSLISKYGSSLRIAELIYKEKVFFSVHAPQIDRPRDDKAASLVRMLHEEVELMRAENDMKSEEGTDQDEAGNSNHKRSSSTGFGIETDSEHSDMWTPLLTEQTPTLTSDPDGSFFRTVDSQTNATTFSASVVPPCQARHACTSEERPQLLARISESWGAVVPQSLQAMYVQAQSVMSTETKADASKLQLGKSSLGTMPLRDLVKSLHNKSVGNVKVMREAFDPRQS